MQISAKLGLRAQEIALLQIKEVARLKKIPARIYPVQGDVTTGGIHQGCQCHGPIDSQYTRRTVSFSVEAFDQVVAQIVDLAKAGVEVDPKRFYPAVKKRTGQSRDLPLVDEDLRRR